MSGCTDTEKRLQILLSTYNGVRYLKEQLESYRPIARTLPYQVLIRDDGSTDGTQAILAQYAAEENIEVVYGENVGLNASYSWLVAHSNPLCNYYAISDQDDQWFANKLEIAVQNLEKAERFSCPALFASRSILTDVGMTPIGETELPHQGMTFYNAMLQNPCPGHTQVLNRPLMELMQRYCHPDMVTFDWWVYLVATAFGEVVFSPEATVWHRQHGDNTVGYGKTKWTILQGRVARVLCGDGRRVTRQLQALLTCAGHVLPTSYRIELEQFLRGQKLASARLWYFFYGRAFRQTWLDSFLFRWIYLFGGYKL